MDFNRIISGAIRAARLDVSFYEEVEKDTSYDQDALVVVIISSLIGALGALLGQLFQGQIVPALIGFVVGALLAVAGFYLWVYVAHFVGTKMFKGTADIGEVRRTLGFAYAPQLVMILGAIPCLGAILGLAVMVWRIATSFIAIRQSMDMDNTNAALTAVISAVIVFVVIAIVTAIFAALGIAGAAVTGALK